MSTISEEGNLGILNIRTEVGAADSILQAMNKINHNFDQIVKYIPIKLLENQTYYISNLIGEDTNDGSQDKPWKTLTYASERLIGLNFNTYTVTIYVLPGVYINQALTISNSNGKLRVIGVKDSNEIRPTISLDYRNTHCIKSCIDTYIENIIFTADSTTTSSSIYTGQQSCITIENAKLEVKDINFGSFSAAHSHSGHIVLLNSIFIINNSYEISGSYASHLSLHNSKVVVVANLNPIRIAIPNAIIFNSFALLRSNSFLDLGSSNNIIFDGPTILAKFYQRDLSSGIREINLGSNFSQEGVVEDADLGIVRAQEPVESANSNQVATTAWVNNLLEQKINQLENVIRSFCSGIDPYTNQELNLESTFPILPLFPIGTIISCAGSTNLTDFEDKVPGWLICDGRAVSQDAYRRLFQVIGTTYGLGDSSTTFNLPDLRGATIIGYNSTKIDIPNLPIGTSTGVASTILTVNHLPIHSHNIVNTPHKHNVKDNGHSHLIKDKPHSHNDTFNIVGIGQEESERIAYTTGTAFSLTTESSYTGITNTEVRTSDLEIIANQSVSTCSNTGLSQPLSMYQPSIAMVFLIKF